MVRWELRKHPLFPAYTALLAVYVFWGTTYLAIRMALEGISPLVMIATRFIASGTILLLAARMAGARLPRGRELAWTALFGILILGGGNGALTFAELWIPSGLAALFITTGPFWMIGLEALLPRGERLHWPTMAGALVGFSGVLLLIAPGVSGSTLDWSFIRGFLILQAGCASWSLGSLLQRRLTTEAHPVVSGAVQQMATGLAYVIPASLSSEHRMAWSGRSYWALLWLIVFGSIVGYSAYVYVLQKLPIAVSSTYTYVNPLVAVLLGSLVYAEPFGAREVFAMLSIFTGVAIVKYFSARPAPAAES